MEPLKITKDTFISGAPVAAGTIVETDENTARLLKGYNKAVTATPEDIAAAEKANKKNKQVVGKEVV